MPSKKHLHKFAIISALKSSKNNLRSHLIKNLNNKGIDILSECIFNTCYVDQGLSKKDKNRIYKIYKGSEKALKSISRKSNTTKTRRKLLSQHGASLTPILSIGEKVLSSKIFGHS